MLKNRTSLVGALLAVGALGATAGMLAWRWSQGHRAQRTNYYRDLNRWEGEGGALAANGGASAVATFGAGGPKAAASHEAAVRRGDGAAGEPWPFPHGNA